MPSARLLCKWYSIGGVSPVARFNERYLELVLDEKLARPTLRVWGNTAKMAYTILAKRFLVRGSDGGFMEVPIPLMAFPAVSVWLLASYGREPSEDMLNELFCYTPRLLADFIWDLVEISGSDAGRRGPLIDHKTALKASKIVREMLNLYQNGWRGL